MFAVADQLDAAGIGTRVLALETDEVKTVFESGRVHLALMAWTSEDDRAAWAALAGEANVIDLYSLPISYKALPEFTITITPGGWPLASR